MCCAAVSSPSATACRRPLICFRDGPTDERERDPFPQRDQQRERRHHEDRDHDHAALLDVLEERLTRRGDLRGVAERRIERDDSTPAVEEAPGELFVLRKNELGDRRLVRVEPLLGESDLHAVVRLEERRGSDHAERAVDHDTSAVDRAPLEHLAAETRLETIERRLENRELCLVDLGLGQTDVLHGETRLVDDLGVALHLGDVETRAKLAAEVVEVPAQEGRARLGVLDVGRQVRDLDAARVLDAGLVVELGLNFPQLFLELAELGAEPNLLGRDRVAERGQSLSVRGLELLDDIGRKPDRTSSAHAHLRPRRRRQRPD